MKVAEATREFKESMGNFDRLLRAVVAVPKAAVKREEAKERLKNQAIRAKRKRVKKKV